jgi:uncharacterized protein (DUF58 family)
LLTGRGWWLLFILLLQVAFGAAVSPRFGEGIAVIGLVLLAWFLFEWANFVYRAYFVLPNLSITREVHDQRKAVPVLWSGGEFDVRLRAELTGFGDLPYVAIEDWVPFDAKVLEGNDALTTAISAEQPGRFSYLIKCVAPGELRFEGVRVRIADRQGFFYHRVHLRENVVYPVLPRLTGAEGNRRGFKRHNIFPPPGLHRLKQPGGGTELLDLRDYLPGDPPKMIAWKASARRDKLFTKEFESEVPVRCTMFVDASEGTRIGTRAKNKITKLVNLAAGVAEATVANRDHVGLVVFDEHNTQIMRPKRTRRHVIDMLHMLAKAAARTTPLGPFADAGALARLSYPIASELYPELMSKKTNTIPFGMFWKPAGDTKALWWIMAFALPALLIFMSPCIFLFGWFQGLMDVAVAAARTEFWFLRNFGVFGTLVTGFASVAIAFLIWLIHGLSGTMGTKAIERMQRKQLGLLFATLDGDEPGAESHYLHDDQIFARRAMRFLADHHARYPVRLYDARGRFLFRGKPKLDVLAKALNYGVARGRDNELFVLLADLIDLADDLDPIIQAVRVAIARHHQVMLIIPWQEDIPDPPKEAPKSDTIPKRKAERFVEGGYRAIIDEIERDAIKQYHMSYFKIRREFGRLGVLVVRAEQDETVQMVLDRMDRLRGVGRRR